MNPRAPHLALAALMTTSALALSACGSDDTKTSSSLATVSQQKQASAAPSPSSSSATTSSPTSSASSAAAPSTSTSSASSSSAQGSDSAAPSRRPGIPSTAYAGAGGPAPSNAQPATNDYYVSKTGNTHCNFFSAEGSHPESAFCFSWALTQGEHQDDTPLGGISSVSLTADGQTQAAPQSEAPPYMQKNAHETVLNYGQAVTRGPFVCVGESTGTTCWETNSGHGFVISKTAISRF